jgi:2-keto-4-pentenoate hydratase/2-oxohepta-3-ene-1,7-dioic acid hydratase in catechol pathway
MKIVCIGRNYADHAKELGNAVPDEPVVFMKPSSAMIHNSKPFFIPAFTNDVHYELELVYRITNNGRHIEEQFAHRYYDSVGLGIDFTARDIQQKLKAKGLPWEKAKAFDGSAAMGEYVALDSLPDPKNINFQLFKNGEEVQTGQSSHMLHDIDAIIAHVSQYFVLTVGDLIFTGTPAGVGKVEIGDHLLGKLEGKTLLDLRVK